MFFLMFLNMLSDGFFTKFLYILQFWSCFLCALKLAYCFLQWFLVTACFTKVSSFLFEFSYVYFIHYEKLFDCCMIFSNVVMGNFLFCSLAFLHLFFFFSILFYSFSFC